jgi:hypothetical protein
MSTAIIDTGTTNIAGPASAVESIYAQIPGSQPGSGQWAGYYLYRKHPSEPTYDSLADYRELACSTTVNVEFNFGGISWSMSPADFTHTQISSSQCIGAFFTSTIGQGGPSWIIGDAFLVSSHR